MYAAYTSAAYTTYNTVTERPTSGTATRQTTVANASTANMTITYIPDPTTSTAPAPVGNNGPSDSPEAHPGIGTGKLFEHLSLLT
jgi:hypothetical protein